MSFYLLFVLCYVFCRALPKERERGQAITCVLNSAAHHALSLAARKPRRLLQPICVSLLLLLPLYLPPFQLQSVHLSSPSSPSPLLFSSAFLALPFLSLCVLPPLASFLFAAVFTRSTRLFLFSLPAAFFCAPLSFLSLSPFSSSSASFFSRASDPLTFAAPAVEHRAGSGGVDLAAWVLSQKFVQGSPPPVRLPIPSRSRCCPRNCSPMRERGQN